MKGVTKQDYLFNKNANNQAFAKSVAKLIDGVQEADVTIESVEDDVNARRSLRAAGATTQAVGVVITYTIQVSNTQAAGFSNAQVAYDAIVNQITAAITSGSFTTELRRIAQEIGATVLTIVVIDETASFTEPIIILVPAPEPTTAKAEKKDKWLDAYTAAIVVAGVLILYFLLRSRFFHLYTARVKVHIHGKSAANVVLSKIVNEMPDSMYIHSNQSIRVKGEILYEVDSRDKEQFLFVCVHVKVDGIRSLKRERGCMSAWSEEICGDAVEETRSLVEADIKHIMDKFILRDFSTDIQVELNGVVVSTGHDGGIRADFNNNMLSQGIDEIMAVEGMSTRL